MQEISGAVREFIDVVLNQGQIDATDRFFWDDMVEQAPFPGQGPGVEGLKDRASRLASCVSRHALEH